VTIQVSDGELVFRWLAQVALHQALRGAGDEEHARRADSASGLRQVVRLAVPLSVAIQSVVVVVRDRLLWPGGGRRHMLKRSLKS
jgi:hypothetical protein